MFLRDKLLRRPKNNYHQTKEFDYFNIFLTLIFPS